jgi:hypothetical protein
VLREKEREREREREKERERERKIEKERKRERKDKYREHLESNNLAHPHSHPQLGGTHREEARRTNRSESQTASRGSTGR